MTTRNILAGLAVGAVVALSACGAPNNKNDAGTGGGTGGHTGGGTGGGTGGATGGGTGGGATGGGTGGGAAGFKCGQSFTIGTIAASATKGGYGDQSPADNIGWFGADVNSPLAIVDAGTDLVELEYYYDLPGPATFPHTGPITGPDLKIATCLNCIYYYAGMQDLADGGSTIKKLLFATSGNVNFTSGTATFDDAGVSLGGAFAGSATNVHLVEWKYGNGGAVDHAVDGGLCLDIANVSFNATW